MTSSLTNSARFLKLVSVQLKWSRNPPWYSHLVWIIPRWLHANLSKWVQQIWNLTDAGRQTWVADECQSWQRHLSSWCYGKAKWLSFLNWESSSDSTLFIVLESMAKPSIFPLFIACSILLTIFTTSCQSSPVVVVVCGLLETFQQLGNLGSTRRLAALPLPTCGITHCQNWKRTWWI